MGQLEHGARLLINPQWLALWHRCEVFSVSCSAAVEVLQKNGKFKQQWSSEDE
jgi:hypothetical protein